MAIATVGNVNIYDGNKFIISTADSYYFPLPDYGGYYHLYVDRNQRLWGERHEKTAVHGLAHGEVCFRYRCHVQAAGRERQNP